MQRHDEGGEMRLLEYQYFSQIYLIMNSEHFSLNIMYRVITAPVSLIHSSVCVCALLIVALK